MRNPVIQSIESKQLRVDVPNFNAGDTIRVHTKIKEGDKERVQMFEGIVLKKRAAGLRSAFTVRKVSYGVGVERTFPMHSPRIEKITVVSGGRVRRARIYFIRDLHGKAARLRGEEVRAADTK
ncbi:50S ribosomal protein L19 [Vulgatibacter incomptus]|uniref:Large ribosomal subunit protein bL19 n=1 Tax=Vulgatibacter incomptus TaxID=1391653 RepID=A0A0K1PCQ5_9BACT|nr:50S ribosomal protein L19 [Vulgatibacter incomptus]AKU91282.1 LSU ribosomal protein L19p [Vulgatibacter incomptus]